MTRRIPMVDRWYPLRVSTPPEHDTLAALRRRIAQGRTTAAAETDAALKRARAAAPLNALVDILDVGAPERAAEIDRRLAAARSAGEDPGATVGALAGVPIIIKDNICLHAPASVSGEGGPLDARTTCGSRILENYRSPFTASAAQRLLDAGAVIIAKSNMDEFAMGSSGEHSAFGPTRNPWDPSRVPGGSSSGSSAAVAAGIATAALGSDTGGSIRQPAGMCNLVGIKPTYGRVSRSGLVAYASSLDQIGPLTRTVEDAAIMLSVICGHDPLDSTSLSPEAHVHPGSGDFTTGLETPVEGLVLGVPTQATSSANHPSVLAALNAAAAVYRSLGATIVEIALPSIEQAIAAYYIIATAEASSNLARFDGIRYGRRARAADGTPGDDLLDVYARSRSEGFGAEVQRRIMLGTYVLSAGYYEAYYNTALKARRLVKDDYDAAFRSGVHAVLTPSSPSPAFPIGAKADDPLAMYLEDVYTVGVNLAGLPAITFPGGFVSTDPNDGNLENMGRADRPKGRLLPLGMQLVGPAMGERELLRAARMFEGATGHWKRTAAGE